MAKVPRNSKNFRMTQKKLILLVRKRIANTSISPATARGMGPEGTIKKGREFLFNLDLNDFVKKDEPAFRKVLDIQTERLRKSLPRNGKSGQHFGSARKFLNIFLRNALYNRYLYREYKLKKIEPWLEIPVDSHVIKGIESENSSKNIPKWEGVIHLSSWENEILQCNAAKIAKSKKMHRVHLDLLYWRNLELSEKTRKRSKRHKQTYK